ncbi:hypothetical protein KSF_061110 [Reticulibacter mediterranei]|uniref:Uncharacterized protein n=1 Tax=Reticulibacter mediterranei TaxID=2778369 RepID=A0A8J3ILJ1_9CHLR|nr:hypothetical protein [Reticulibacter mediterranei]GHO96063.1 hypothetical protein KSF_061110 [Reticulibacter mediterranei]
MDFCGQCGFQLAPEDTRCPRCGAAIEPGEPSATGNMHPNAPTEQARSFIANRPSPTSTQGYTHPPTQQNEMQQKLVLRPGWSDDNYSTAAASDATSMMDQPMMGNAYPTAYPQQSATNYPPAGGFPPQTYGGFAPPSGRLYNNTPVPNAYPGSSPYQGMQESVSHTSKGRSAGLVLILIGLLFILSSILLFILQHNGAI